MGYDLNKWWGRLNGILTDLQGLQTSAQRDELTAQVYSHVQDLADECEHLAADVHRLTTEQDEIRAKVRAMVKLMKGEPWDQGGAWVNSLTEAIGDPHPPPPPNPESCTNCSHLQPMWPEMTYYGVCDQGHGTLKHGQCFRGLCGGSYKPRRVRL